jgi:hypothetical protein
MQVDAGAQVSVTVSTWHVPHVQASWAHCLAHMIPSAHHLPSVPFDSAEQLNCLRFHAWRSHSMFLSPSIHLPTFYARTYRPLALHNEHLTCSTFFERTVTVDSMSDAPSTGFRINNAASRHRSKDLLWALRGGIDFSIPFPLQCTRRDSFKNGASIIPACLVKVHVNKGKMHM